MATNEKRCKPDRWNLYRILASAFVLGGGLFWALTVFVGFGSVGASPIASVGMALVWVALTAIVFVVGLFWERVAAVLLGAAALVGIGAGLFFHYEPGVWLQFSAWILLPIIISATLYGLAGQEAAVCALDEGVSGEGMAPGATA